MSRVKLKDVRKTFSDDGGEIVAVDNFNLEIKNGEFVVFVGPSGSGKSTTLRLIAGLEEVTSGEIHIGEEEVTDSDPRDRDVAMVFQNYALYPHLNVEDNISFGLKMQGEMSEDAISEKVRDSAEMLGISELLGKMPNELSGGQQQRVSLGRAIVRNPSVFLMDEPLSNLDAKLRTKMRTEIQELQAELETTTIYVTHDQTEAMTMADRIAIMNHGELQQVATPLEAYHNPSNEFVAGFIGSPSMNFITVSTEWEGDRLILEHPEFRYQASPSIAEAIGRSHSEVVLGIRPEDIEIVGDPDKNGVVVDLNVIEPLGNEQLLHFELGDSTYTANVSGEYPLSENQRVSVGFPADKVHLFDSDTGDALKNREVSEKPLDNEITTKFADSESAKS